MTAKIVVLALVLWVAMAGGVAEATCPPNGPLVLADPIGSAPYGLCDCVSIGGPIQYCPATAIGCSCQNPNNFVFCSGGCTLPTPTCTFGISTAQYALNQLLNGNDLQPFASNFMLVEHAPVAMTLPLSVTTSTQGSGTLTPLSATSTNPSTNISYTAITGAGTTVIPVASPGGSSYAIRLSALASGSGWVCQISLPPLPQHPPIVKSLWAQIALDALDTANKLTGAAIYIVEPERQARLLEEARLYLQLAAYASQRFKDPVDMDYTTPTVFAPPSFTPAVADGVKITQAMANVDNQLLTTIANIAGYLDASQMARVSDRGIEGPPTLAIEVLSPTTASADRGIQRQICARYGVPHYWIVDADACVVETYRLAGVTY